jgi:hypothetical protein
MQPEKIKSNPEKPEALLEKHWFKIAEKLYEESGEVPDPARIRAEAIVEVLGIPSGEWSALEVDKEGSRVDPEKDKIIAEYLTNKSGVIIDKNKGVVSSDFRDIYPDGLPQELKDILDSDTLAIMEVEYEQVKQAKKDLKNDCLVNYFRLPGGIDLFLRAYIHNGKWQKNYGEFLKEANKHAKIICIEGFVDLPFASSLDLLWSEWERDYGVLMREAVSAGFDGLFTEVDARDNSRVEMDNVRFEFFPQLPATFLDKYFDFLQKEHPTLTKIIGSPKNLKEYLIAQSATKKSGVRSEGEKIYSQGKLYINHLHLSKEYETSLEPTFLELGQYFFTDALAAIKLHLIAKLMSDGYLKKGPIIDYEGARHLSSKSFFLRYPQYAMEVVLRTINELMVGSVNNLSEIYKVFENPNWSEIVKEISRLTFKGVEDDASKSSIVGSKQRKLIEKPIDFLETYNINSRKVVPTDEEIKEIRKKLQEISKPSQKKIS